MAVGRMGAGALPGPAAKNSCIRSHRDNSRPGHGNIAMTEMNGRGSIARRRYDNRRSPMGLATLDNRARSLPATRRSTKMAEALRLATEQARHLEDKG